MLYAGVDAHKKYSQVVLTDDHGTKIAQASLSNDPGCFQEFFKQATEPVKAVVEAGRTWGVIYDLLESIWCGTSSGQSSQDPGHCRS